jgi:rubrerythrin
MRFKDLKEAQILALAIHTEEEDARIYRDFAESFKLDFPESATVFETMAQDEDRHKQHLTDLYKSKFGEHIPLIRRQDVKGMFQRKAFWFNEMITPEKAMQEAIFMEKEARSFYELAAKKTNDTNIRELLTHLAVEEQHHEHKAEEIDKERIASGIINVERETAKRLFVLRFVQPGLAGLMDGSVSTLAPLFAAAFATANPGDTFKVGLAASIGAGISMAFAEALSDDGKISGRGSPVLRGLVCGAMTSIGGLGHTFPFLIPQFKPALTLAIIVVVVELAIISWIRNHFMDTPLLSAIFQVVVGGILVFIVGWLIGAG